MKLTIAVRDNYEIVMTLDAGKSIKLELRSLKRWDGRPPTKTTVLLYLIFRGHIFLLE